ncbi:phage gp6-like head-tail connector protein [Olsenella profusa]|uniref:Phage gp6-like head-tail connector protein n=1 Tax=Olsenella profusa F0195 TaxID=1125712 RepID=U2TU31_9ACTN|nr:phage gp6-like head-tail connector protein [Olsenella profusa]ERL09850.1 Phage gp6-like head-tail connector protein [Olsenella profusa F0195]
MAVLDRVKARLDAWEDVPSDEWLAEAVQSVSDRVCLRAGVARLPALAESIVVDATVKAVNRRFDEGITSESEGQGDVMSVTFVDDLLSEYDRELSALADMARADGSSGLPKVRFV